MKRHRRFYMADTQLLIIRTAIRAFSVMPGTYPADVCVLIGAYRSAERNCSWSQNAVCRILTNELYTGKIINGKEEVADFLTGQRLFYDIRFLTVDFQIKIISNRLIISIHNIGHTTFFGVYFLAKFHTLGSIRTLEAQKQFFAEYTKKTGDTLVRLYADEGISGTKIKNRKEFLKMMSDAEHGLFDMVVPSC